jgi:hypothetical protein
MIQRCRAWIARHRRRAVAIGVVAGAIVSAAIVSVAVWVVSTRPSPAIEFATPTTIELHGAASIDAGDPWLIDVGSLPEGEPIDVDVITFWGTRRLPPVAPGSPTITVPGELTRRSGRLSVMVRAGSGVGAISTDIVPGAAVDGVTPLAGPRSIVADNADWTMVTMFPRDRFGNSVVDGTPVTVFVRRPGGQLEQVTSEVQSLYAAARVYAQTRAGRTALRVGAGDPGATAVGQEVEVLEVPGPPVEVAVELPSIPLRADGRMLVTLRTGVLVDRYDNVLLDGTAAVVRFDGPDGLGTLRAASIDGRVEFVIEAPREPGSMSVAIDVGGVVSEQVMLDFVADVSALPVRVTRQIDTLQIEVGRVLTTHGGFVPDGTPVTVRAASGTITGTLRDGAATLVSEADAGELIEVEVLGAVTEVVAP